MGQAVQIPQHEHERVAQAGRGREATSPLRITGYGWLDVLRRVKVELKRDKCSLLAAGVAFYALVALVPALVALVSVYGLFSDPEQVGDQVSATLEAAPAEVQDLVDAQLRAISSSSDAGLTTGLVVGLVVAIWSASRGTNHLISAVNAAYDEREDRNLARRRGMALLAVFGATVFLVTAFWLLAVLPSVASGPGWGEEARVAVTVLRWPLLAAGLLLGLALLYRYAPDRVPPGWRWVSVGSVVAMLLWLLGSVGLSLYTSRFADLNETYGTLGVIVVVLLWLFLSAYAVLLGAEVNSEIEHQVATDTTVGPPRPLGDRGATVADRMGAATFEEHVGTGI